MKIECNLPVCNYLIKLSPKLSFSLFSFNFLVNNNLIFLKSLAVSLSLSSQFILQLFLLNSMALSYILYLVYLQFCP